jgi:hypothetical protein
MVKDLWLFLKEYLNKLKYSSYGKYIIKRDNTKHSINDNYYCYNNEKINLKNIYNIAKSLSHTNIIDWILLPKNYMSLSLETITEFFTKIFNPLQDYNLLDKIIRKF